MSDVPHGLPPDSENISRGGFNLHAGPIWRLPSQGEGPGEIRRFALPVADKHMNGSGNVHGGLLMTFADIAMSQSARAAAGGKACATVSLTCDFVGPGKAGDILEARVHITRLTRTMVFLSCEIAGGGEAPRAVAMATGLWKIL